MAAGVHGTEVRSAVSTGDATLKATAGFIHWITISNTHANEATAVELADDAVDVWGVTVETSVDLGAPFHVVFDPPIWCKTSIVIDITNGTVKATVGYT